jgi:hypothetical protein
MSERIEEARRNLKQIRTLKGWKEAYRTAGLPNADKLDNLSKKERNTYSKRLSRVINRRTGGYNPLTQTQATRVSNTIQDEMYLDGLAELRAEKAIKRIDRVKAEGRKETRATFGKDGEFPSTRQLKLNLDKNKKLTPEQKARVRDAFSEARETGNSALIRRAYSTLLAEVDISNLEEERREDFQRKVERAERAVERDNQ